MHNLFLSICLIVLVNYFSDIALLLYYSWCFVSDVGTLYYFIHSILFYLNFLFLASVFTCFSSMICNCYLRPKILIVCLHNQHMQIEFQLISMCFKSVYTKAYVHWEYRVHIRIRYCILSFEWVETFVFPYDYNWIKHREYVMISPSVPVSHVCFWVLFDAVL